MTDKKDQINEEDFAEYSLLQKLLYIQRRVDAFVKDSQGHNYSYPSGNQILNKIRPLMNKVGVLLEQEVVSSTHQKVTYLNSYGDEKAEMFCTTEQLFTWVDTHNGEERAVRWTADGMNGWDKGLGSALTYGERYFLLKYFHVPTDADDPDTDQDDKSSTARGNSSGSKYDGEESDRGWLNKTHKNSEELTDDWREVTDLVYGEPKKLNRVFREWKVNKRDREELTKIAKKELPKPHAVKGSGSGNDEESITPEQYGRITELAEHLSGVRRAGLADHLKKGITKDSADSIIRVLEKNKDLRLRIQDLRDNGYNVPDSFDRNLNEAQNPADYAKVDKELDRFVKNFEDVMGA